MTLHETITQSDTSHANYLVELERRWFELMVIVCSEEMELVPITEFSANEYATDTLMVTDERALKVA